MPLHTSVKSMCCDHKGAQPNLRSLDRGLRVTNNVLATGADAPRHAGQDRVTVTVDLARYRMNISRSAFYNLLRQGKVRAVKSGRRTLVIWQSVLDYLDSLPDAKFQAANAPASPNRTGTRDGDATSPVAPRRHRGQRQ